METETQLHQLRFTRVMFVRPRVHMGNIWVAMQNFECLVSTLTYLINEQDIINEQALNSKKTSRVPLFTVM